MHKDVVHLTVMKRKAARCYNKVGHQGRSSNAAASKDIEK